MGRVASARRHRMTSATWSWSQFRHGGDGCFRRVYGNSAIQSRAESLRRAPSAEEGKKLGGTLHGNRSALEVTRVPRHQNIGTGAQTRRHLNRVLEVGEREGECSTKIIAAQLHDVDDIEQIAHGGDGGSPAVLALDDVMNRRERVTGD